MTPSSLPMKSSPRPSASTTTATWRRPDVTPFQHTAEGCARALHRRAEGSLNSTVASAVRWSRRDIGKGVISCLCIFHFPGNGTQTGHNSCYTSPSGDVDRTTSRTSLSLHDGPVCFGATYRVAPSSPKSPAFWRLKGDQNLASRIRFYAMAKLFFTQPKKRHRNGKRKDADHTRTFHCCHDAVHRPASPEEVAFSSQPSALFSGYHRCHFELKLRNRLPKLNRHLNGAARPLAA